MLFDVDETLILNALKKLMNLNNLLTLLGIF